MRLYQGDYAQETVFSENPLEVALHWQALGAPRIHVVDLDGAASGDVVNLEVDIIAKYVERLVGGRKPGVSLEFLGKHGYLPA